MANSSSKGLAIGVVVLLVVGALFFVMTRNKQEPAAPETAAVSQTTPPAQEAPAASETASAPAEATPDETPAPETDSTASAETTTGEIVSPGLTSPAGEEAAASSEPSATAESSTEAEAPAEAASATAGSLLEGPEALDIDIDKATADRSIGRDDAPVSVIEYASMTCPHCARFHNDILPGVKQELIDTGKLRLIYRDYPLDTYAMKAAMMARCAEPDRYFDLLEVIFKNQDRWAKNEDPTKGLIQLGTLAGMNEDYIKACMANEELQSVILHRVTEAQKNYRLNSTPTFVFNSGAEVMSGDKDVKDFVTVVNRLIRK